MLIRVARPGDELEVARVHVRSWQSAYAGLLPKDLLAGLDPARRAAGYTFGVDRAGVPATVVAEEEGRVLGFATTGAAWDADARGAGELFGLYVDPDHWRRGCGTLLMSEARARLAGLGFADVVLWVLEGNKRAAAFYRADGWARDGTERDDDIGPAWKAASTATCEIPVLHEARYRRRLSVGTASSGGVTSSR
jgi:GNAT superfamily N-acetyltransferase